MTSTYSNSSLSSVSTTEELRTSHPLRIPTLDIVIPVFNEEESIQQAVDTVRAFFELWAGAPKYRITIADNASTDSTLKIAQSLSLQDSHVRVVHFDQKGRGRALKASWLASDADIVMYMDVDLATDLSALPSLVTPLLTGVAHVAIGSRLHRYSRVVRGPRREFISRTYNRIIRFTTGARFSDAQCGFKAMTSDAAKLLLPHVTDNVWFFDTELLLLADYCGLHIAEIPVDWVDDPRSSVNIISTALEDLKGIGRVLYSRMRGAYPRNEIRRTLIHPLRSQMGRSIRDSGTLLQQALIFGLIGILSTVLQAVLYWAISFFCWRVLFDCDLSAPFDLVQYGRE